MSAEFGRRARLLIFGRVTYEGMKAYWTTTEEETETKAFMNALPKLVASRSLRQSDWNNTQVTDRIVDAVTRLRAEPGKDIFVFGSADLTATLLAAGLIDELMLGLVPTVLGKGTRFFNDRDAASRFDLIEARPLKTGTVILRYAPKAARQDTQARRLAKRTE